MSTNFEHLGSKEEYRLFAQACIEAEKVLNSSPSMAVIGCRKALELAVKWVYSADSTMKVPYKDNLQALIHEPSFRFAVDATTWSKIPYIIKIGNLAVHTDKTITKGDAVLALSSLFEFIKWVDYCYGVTYEERQFNDSLLPEIQDTSELKRILEEKDAKIESLLNEVASQSERYTENKGQHQQQRKFTPEELSEIETRRKYIDVDLRLLGWEFKQGVRKDCVEIEVPVVGMPKNLGSGNGFVDYVLYGRDGTPLALIEAKKTIKDARVGTHQGKLYADCIEKMTGCRPIIFTSNGFETHIWDDQTSPQRQVSGVFSIDDLQRIYNRRTTRKKLNTIEIDDNITERYYQKEAIRAICGNIMGGHQRSLLVMATGTGKTRTACSLTDVLSRGGYITNTLFLADRTALVRQAKDEFKTFLPAMSLCNLLSNKDDRNARIVFSTYPTMLNAIDQEKTEEGQKLFTPAHFDLIIIDEAHRSIFKKYRAIFEYFDAYIVGLTATPKNDVHANTYEFFEVVKNVPTYAYDYETAVEKDKVLVPYHNIEVKTKFLSDGITYDELPLEDKERYEDDFTDEDGEMPDAIPAPEINKFIFNQNTVDNVINDLMTNGSKETGETRLGKTIIFAQNKIHAQFIVDRFNKLYPLYKGEFCKRIVCDDSYAQDLIDQFKNPIKEPHIAVSVDMLDTGIDVREIVNLVFFKKIYSKTKFWQMIGRGTRIRPDLFGPGKDKQCFYIFDYLQNFEYFRVNKDGKEGTASVSLPADIFAKRIRLIFALQDSAFMSDDYQSFRVSLIDLVVNQINALSIERVDVKLRLRYVVKYKDKKAFTCLSDLDKKDLIENIAELVSMNDNDDSAVKFDNFMYSLMLTQIEGSKAFNRSRKNVMYRSGVLLNKKMTIPQVKAKEETLKAVLDEKFWENANLLGFEQIRLELRELMKFIDGENIPIIYTDLMDQELERKEGLFMDPGFDYEDYRTKVNRYIEENMNMTAIYKLRNNIPLTAMDYQLLERVLFKELGSKEEYKEKFGDTPLGLMIRKIAKLEYSAALKAFSDFINEQSLDQNQIVFVNKIIDYIAQNGYIEDVSVLARPPFDKPQNFIRLFDKGKMIKLAKIISDVRENAVKVV